MTADLEARIRVLEERGDQLAAAASAALMSGGTPSTATERIRTAVYAWEADRRDDDGQAVTEPPRADGPPFVPEVWAGRVHTALERAEAVRARWADQLADPPTGGTVRFTRTEQPTTEGWEVTDMKRLGGTVDPPTSYMRTVFREVTATEFHDIVENALQRPRPEVCLPCTLGLPCPNLPKEPTP